MTATDDIRTTADLRSRVAELHAAREQIRSGPSTAATEQQHARGTGRLDLAYRRAEVLRSERNIDLVQQRPTLRTGMQSGGQSGLAGPDVVVPDQHPLVDSVLGVHPVHRG